MAADLAETLRELISLTKEVAAIEKAKLSRPTAKLTRRERSILSAIGRGQSLGRTIAEALDLEFTHSFQDTLAMMVRYGVLLNDEAGYAVAEPYWHLLEEPEPPVADANATRTQDGSRSQSANAERGKNR